MKPENKTLTSIGIFKTGGFYEVDSVAWRGTYQIITIQHEYFDIMPHEGRIYSDEIVIYAKRIGGMTLK